MSCGNFTGGRWTWCSKDSAWWSSIQASHLNTPLLLPHAPWTRSKFGATLYSKRKSPPPHPPYRIITLCDSSPSQLPILPSLSSLPISTAHHPHIFPPTLSFPLQKQTGNPEELRRVFHISERQYFQMDILALALHRDWKTIEGLLTTKGLLGIGKKKKSPISFDRVVRILSQEQYRAPNNVRKHFSF